MTTTRALSPDQREFFEAQGFLRIPRALDADAVTALRAVLLRMRDEDALTSELTPASDDSWRDQFDLPLHEKQAACDRARWEATNVVVRDQALLELIDLPSALPLIVDLLGDNIFLMGTRAMIRDQVRMSEREFAEFPLDWHRDLGSSAVEMAEPHPRLSIKVAYWLTALDGPGQGATQVVPGSHRLTGRPPIDSTTGHPYGAVEIHAEPGDALLFEQRLWHAAAPNITDRPRFTLFYGYGYRWLRPDDYNEVSPDLLNRLPAARRQLLGDAQTPSGRYLPTAADLPLPGWLDHSANG